MVFTLDTGALDGSQEQTSKQRTEVCKEITNVPQFKKTIAIPVVEDFASIQANLKGGIFKVTKEGGDDPSKSVEGGAAKEGKVELEGNCEAAVYEHIAELQAGKVVRATVACMQPGSGVQRGTVDLDMALIKPASVTSPKPADEKRASSTSPNTSAPQPAPAPAPPPPRAPIAATKPTPAAPAPAPAPAAAAPAPAPGTRGPQDPQAQPPAAAPRVRSEQVRQPHPTGGGAVAGTGSGADPTAARGVAPSTRVVTLVVRHAINLPVSGHAEEAVLPTPFVAVKSQRDAQMKRPAKSSTTAVKNSRHPIWNQTLVVEVLEEDLQRQEGNIIVAVINHTTKRRIAQISLPAHRMVPSEQYNLEVRLNPGKENSRLWLTAALHDTPAGEKKLLMKNPHLTRIEMLLKGCGVGRPLPFEAEESVAVVRVVPDAEGYVRRCRKLAAAAVDGQEYGGNGSRVDDRPNTYPLEEFGQLETDSTTGQATKLPEVSTAQLTPAVGPGDQPAWNETLYFTVPTDRLHADGAALLIELYQRGVHLTGSQASGPLARDGLRSAARAREELPAPPPELFLGYALLQLAPLMRSGASGPSARQTSTKHIVDELPLTLMKPLAGTGEATRSVLQLELHTWNADSVAPTEMAPAPTGPPLPRAVSGGSGGSGNGNDLLVDRLMREIEEKKDVIRRCGVEVIELRKQGAQLAAHNADLRSMLEREKQASTAMAHEGDEEWEMLTLDELQKRSRLLRKKYRAERQANETLVNKLQLLQNAVMKKNAAEERLRELEDAHISQSELVARLRTENATVEKYKKTVHEQESVIVKLEQLMESALSDKKRLQSALDDAAVHQQIDGGHNIGGRQKAAAAARENAELCKQLEDERDKRTGTANHSHAHLAFTPLRHQCPCADGAVVLPICDAMMDVIRLRPCRQSRSCARISFAVLP
eukprot:COSAG02_NODE_235_length_27784_cov_9.895828_4_plen_933_part_00